MGIVIFCETDNVDVFIAEQSYSYQDEAADFDLISKIIELIRCNWTVEVKLINRDANGVVDTIAKFVARTCLALKLSGLNLGCRILGTGLWTQLGNTSWHWCKRPIKAAATIRGIDLK
ncbi:hypothetical protein PIB30_081224 [Stylosanthes scabra]|uniref:RNase H type-1 domain-containing protein n=1 Tax=Stylosanthes scabra TaxID=79078 RepID=A0ABU6ZQA6_9FABA|nr:hypothetical protein [Stylosanthes scabra]